MISVILYIIGEVFHGMVVALPLIGYLPVRKNKCKSFLGFTLMYLTGIPIIVSLFVIATEFSPDTEVTRTIYLLRILTSFFFLFLMITFYFFTLHLNFKGTVRKKVFLTLFLVITESLTVKSVVIFVNHFFPRNDRIEYTNILDIAINTSAVDFVESVLISIILLIVLTMSFKIFTRGKLSLEVKKIILTTVFFLAQFFSIGLVSELVEKNRDYTLLSKIIFISVPVAFVALYIMYILISNKNELLKHDKSYIEHINAMQSQYINEVAGQFVQITKLKHDFNTHTRIILDLAETGKYSELKNYIREYTEEYALNPILFCTRASLNAVLTNKYQTAKEKNIDIKITFNDSDTDKISDIDLCSVVSNLLQNAIDACDTSEDYEKKRAITLCAGSRADCFIITQENTSKEPNIDFKTTKSDTEKHGIGLGIITDIAKKYNGSVKFEFCDGVFKSTVLFNKL